MISGKKKQNGVVYTPLSIVRRILDGVLPENPDELGKVTLCDPACGDGAFLVPFAQRVLGSLPKRSAIRVLTKLRGYDTDKVALSRCAERLDEALCAWYPNDSINWNLEVRDVLDRNLYKGVMGKFTHVVGNPPYVRIQHIGASRRNRINGKWKLEHGATDLYLLFYEIGLELLRKNGVLSYITPTSWMRSHAGSELRNMLCSEHSVSKVLDYGEHQVFEGVTAYTGIFVIRKGMQPSPIPYWKYDGNRFKRAGLIKFKADKTLPWIPCTSKARKRLEKLYSRGPKLGEIADIHVGVQTLADSVFIVKTKSAFGKRGKYVFCAVGENVFQFEKCILRPIVKASVMKKGKDEVSRAIIYPYDRNGALLPFETIKRIAPNVSKWLLHNQAKLLARDKGTFDEKYWFAWGRAVSITSGFGPKIISSPMNLRPNFQYCPDPGITFFSGYCVKPKNGIDPVRLLDDLNSEEMDFFIRQTSRVYQKGWMSYAKSYIENYPVSKLVLTSS